MAHEILLVKMHELDGKIGRLRSRIQMSESAGHDEIRMEVTALRRECEENALTLCDMLRFSKSGVVAGLSEAYDEVEQAIRRAKRRIGKTDADDWSAQLTAEEKILLAEYTLDFAIQAADRALLISMEALDAQLTQQEKEEDMKS